MRITIAILLCLFAVNAFATPTPEEVKAIVESQPDCDNFVKYDETNVYIGFGPYRLSLAEPRQPIPSIVRVVPVDGGASSDLQTNDSTLDVITVGDSIFVLTYSGLEEWSLKTRSRLAIYPTYQLARPMAYKEHATAIAKLGDTFIISHGRLGVSFFDIPSRKLVNQTKLVQGQLPHESMATGVTISGDTAYVAMDNFTLGEYEGKIAFRGVILFDMQSKSVVRELEGLDPGADAIVTDGKTLIISFGGNPIWKFSLATFGGSKMPPRSGFLMGYPIKGHPTRLPFMDEKYYYTCFFKKPEKGGSWSKLPLAIDRASLKIK